MPARTAAWVAAAVAAVALYGPAYLAVVRPPAGFAGDFIQDWLSARDVLAGRSAYEPLPDALARHTGLVPDPNDEFLAVNAHPPASVLLVLPFAPLSASDAHLAWNLVTLALFGVGVWLVLREVGGPTGWAAVPRAVAVALPCAPLFDQVMFGQFNALLGFLLAAAWVTDRRDRPAWAGACVGAAAAVKLFPAFLGLYLVAAGRWRAAAVAALTFLALNAAAAAALGPGDVQTYATRVVPAVGVEYAGVWRNMSAAAFWTRALAPTHTSRIAPAPSHPELAAGLTALSQLGVVVAVGWAGWVARRSPAARDRGFAAACVGMLLLAPTSWPHYFLLLVVPVALLVARLPGRAARGVMWACLLVAWLPGTQWAKMTLGPERAAGMIKNRHAPLTPAENLLVASLQTYALAGLFALSLRLPGERPA